MSNSLEDMSVNDLYEDHRIIENDHASTGASLDAGLAELRALTGGAPKAAPSVDEGLSEITSLDAQATAQDTAAIGTFNSAVINPGDPDGPGPAAAEGPGVWGKIGSAAQFLAAPLASLGSAALAPIAHEYESEGVLDTVGEAFQVSGKALMDQLFPTYGESKSYGSDISKNLLPNASPDVQVAVGTTLEMIADPTISLGLPMFKAIQTGLRTAASSRAATGGETTAGIIENGLHELFTVGKAPDTSLITDIGSLARKADAGDAASLVELNIKLDSDPLLQRLTTAADDVDVEAYLAKVDDLMGNTDAPDFHFGEGVDDMDAILRSTMLTNDAAKPVTLNVSKMRTTEDMDRILNNVIEVYKADFLKVKGYQSNSATMAKAQNKQLVDLLGTKAKSFLPEEAYALRQALVSSAYNLKTLAQRTLDDSSGIAELAFERSMIVHRAIQEKVTGVGAHAGRLLQSHAITASAGRARVKDVRKLIENIDGNPHTRRVIKQFLAGTSDASQLNKIIHKTMFAKTTDALFEVFTNSILSGPITHMVNIASNGAMLAWAPTETVLKGMSAAARGNFLGAKNDFSESAAMLQGISEGIGDVFRLASKSADWNGLRLPQEMLEMHEMAKLQMRPAITSEELGVSGVLGQFVDYAGKVIRFPGSALVAEDKAFKLIQYRMHTASQATRKANVVNGTAADKAAVFNAFKNNPTDVMKANSIDMSSYYTFTAELGTAGKAMHTWIRSTPGVRYLAPFFKTPTNIVKMGTRNSVVGNVFKDLNAATGLMNEAGDLARARLAMGTMAPMALISMVDLNNISGGVDMATEQGRFKASQGVPPYSIRLGDTWYSYEKIEPLRAVLGLIVNYAEAIDGIEMTDPETGEDTDLYTEAFTTLVSPFIQTVGDAYMLETIGGVMNMLDGIRSGSPEYAGQHLQKTMASMTVPQLLQQLNTTYFDKNYRMADGYLDMLRKRIPGMSSDLAPNRTIWGDEQLYGEGLGVDIISPIKTSTKKLDSLDEELLRLNVPIPSMPKEIAIKGINLELTQEERSEFNRIRGQGFEGGPTLKDTFLEVFNDPAFAVLSDIDKKEILTKQFNDATESTKMFTFGTSKSLQDQYFKKLEAREIQRRSTQQ